MSTISNVSALSVAGYLTPPAGSTLAGGSSAVSSSSPPSTYTSLGSATTAPVTYNAAGQIVTTQLPTVKTTQQAAQAAYFAAENAVTQARDTLMSGASSNSSTTDMFGVSVDATVSDPLGWASLPVSQSAVAGGATATSAQNAYMAAQNAVTQAQGSFTKA